MKRKELILALILVAAAWAVYWPVKNHDFLAYDDFDYVTENWMVQKGLSWEGVVWAFSTGHASNWHPLTWISHMVDVQLFGLQAGWHHFANLLFHLANTVLLFLVLHRMTGALWQSALVAALFALHPLRVESVAWVAERKDVLSAFFWMLTMGIYVSYVGRPGRMRYGALLLAYALGLTAKPMLVTLPFVLLLLDYWPLQRLGQRSLSRDLGKPLPKNKKKKKSKTLVGKAPAQSSFPQWSLIRPLLMEKIPLFVLAGFSSIVTYLVQHHGGAVNSAETFPLSTRMVNAFVSYINYIAKMIWPADLAVFYPHPGKWPLWQALGSVVLLVTITVLAMRGWKRRPYALVGWLWYVGTLVPVIGIVQVGMQAMADRYTYVPLIGIFIIVAWGIPEITERWERRKAMLAASSGAAVLYLSVFTWFQLGHWQNTITLFTRALEVTENNHIAHNNLGVALKEKGEVDSAIRHYRESLRIFPFFSLAHANLGNALRGQGKVNEAIVHYQEALKARPKDEVAHHNLGIALAMKGQVYEAIFHFQESIRVYPYHPGTHLNLGLALAKQERMDEAIACFSEAIRLKPAYPEALFSLGAAYDSQGKMEEAISYYRKALELKAKDGHIHYSLGMALARKGEIEKAARHFSEAARLKPEFEEAHYNLGIANARLGKKKDAAANFSEALRINPDFVEARERLETLQTTAQ